MVTGERARPGVRLTARGAVALIFVITLVSEATRSTTIVGIVFAVACLAAVFLVQPRDLLPLVVTPPLIFFAATLISAVFGTFGAPSMIQALGLGLFTDLSAAAPWLFGGSALMLAVAWFRGLPANVSELRAELRANRPAVPDAKRRRPGEEQAFAPEPEGYFEPRVYGSPREQKD
ncbi:DUF6542 domain-containing protein [Sphaerisporangium corydalis]|uniref:DUF6542 domain-containing protein n=1 Tax=Sphaerisporangium corydalis TaxID=1441875 RepID=A0ABV9EFF4_9ACTN|nr:DUF6542 domain-containing protein [Sphaerisporangium corydalis]